VSGERGREGRGGREGERGEGGRERERIQVIDKAYSLLADCQMKDKSFSRCIE
jgi:hypothetical protein